MSESTVAPVVEQATAGQQITESPAPVAEDLPAAPDQPKPEAPSAPSPAEGASPPPIAVRPETIVEATLEVLLGKAQRTDTQKINLPQPDGEVLTVELEFKAIDGPSYDALVGKCKPKREDAVMGAQYDPEAFEPLLVSEVVSKPKMPAKDWAKLRSAPNWSGGEWASLFIRCQNLCMQGLDVPFSSSG